MLAVQTFKSLLYIGTQTKKRHSYYERKGASCGTFSNTKRNLLIFEMVSAVHARTIVVNFELAIHAIQTGQQYFLEFTKCLTWRKVIAHVQYADIHFSCYGKGN